MTTKSAIFLELTLLAVWAGKAMANGGEAIEDPQATIFKLLIIPFGVATFFSVVITAALGLKMAKNRAVIFPWHRRMAITTVILALCHATLVIFFH